MIHPEKIYDETVKPTSIVFGGMKIDLYPPLQVMDSNGISAMYNYDASEKVYVKVYESQSNSKEF